MQKKYKWKIGTFIWMCAWSIYLLMYIFIRQSEINAMYHTDTIYKIVQISVLAAFIFKMVFFDRYTVKELILYFFIVGLFLINSYIANIEFMLFLFICVISSKGLDFNKFIRYDFFIRCFILIIILLLCDLGIINNYSVLVNGQLKFSVGFYHPNTFGIYIAILLLEWLYIKFYKLCFWDYLIFLSGLISINRISHTRSTIIAFIFIIGLTILIKNKNLFYIKNWINQILILLPIICVLTSFLITFLYYMESPYGFKLNTLLTTRVARSSEFIEKYGIHLFGKEITTIGTRESEIMNIPMNILDMGYVRLAINNGVLILIFFIVVLTLIQKLSIEQKKYPLLICNTFFILIGIIETYVYLVAFNFVIISFYQLILIKKAQNKRDNINLIRGNLKC